MWRGKERVLPPPSSSLLNPPLLAKWSQLPMGGDSGDWCEFRSALLLTPA